MKVIKSLLTIAVAAFAITSCCGGNAGESGSCCGECCKSAVDVSGKADKIVYGNIITMDEHKMRAEAMTLKNGHIQYVGSKKVAESLCDDSTVREDYGENTVYPGFIDVHTHPVTAGERFSDQIRLVEGTTVDEYLQIIKDFVESHPDKTTYRGAGWSPRDREMTAADLDAICADKVIVLNSIDGHSFWLNTAGLEQFGFTREVAGKDGPAMVHVDAEGNPSGVVVEETERMAANGKYDLAEIKENLLKWQEYAFSIGFTAVGDAGFGMKEAIDAYSQMDKDGQWKLRTYCSYYEPIPGQSVEDKVANAVKIRDQYNGDHVKFTGIKMFVDGVVEGHTAWVIDEYLDQPGYTGVKKLSDMDYATELVKKANENGLYVHFHAIGDGAVQFAAGAVEAAQQQTGIFDARNCIAHIQLVTPEDIQKFADNNIVAIVAPLWTPYDGTVSPLEETYIGKQRCENAYPIKSFIDAGAVIAFHSDYPVSTVTSNPKSVVTAVTRGSSTATGARHPEKEGITRLQALQAMTVNSAYALGDDTIGSLETGKVANYVVYDADFLEDPMDKVENSAIVATVIDGEVVYKNE